MNMRYVTELWTWVVGIFGAVPDLRFGSNAYSNYAIWDAIEIEVTVTKNI